MPEVVEVHGAEFFPNLFDGVRMWKITLNVTTAFITDEFTEIKPTLKNMPLYI